MKKVGHSYQDPYLRQRESRGFTTMRVPLELVDRIDAWAQRQATGGSPLKSRNAAMLVLVEKALAAERIA